MTDKELKPCPNCGGQPKIHKTHKKFYVECDGDCWTQTEKHSCQEDAVKEWNTQIAVANEGRQMSDRKFTDDEIIKAAECCLNGNVNKSQVEVCSPCPFFHDGNCTDLLKQNALALINRQKAEIERLRSQVNRLKRYDEERDIALHARLTQKARAEAIKEFAERFKAKQATHFCKCGRTFVYTDLFNGEIDNLVKEMTEELK